MPDTTAKQDAGPKCSLNHMKIAQERLELASRTGRSAAQYGSCAHLPMLAMELASGRGLPLPELLRGLMR